MLQSQNRSPDVISRLKYRLCLLALAGAGALAQPPGLAEPDPARRWQAVQALAAAGARVTYREIPDLSHCYPRDANPGILAWLRSSPVEVTAS